MSHHDQERFENYLEIEQYIEDLQAGRKGILPETLTPAQADIYRMVAQLRSAIPEDAAPRPEFVERLSASLQMKLQESAEAREAEPVVSSPEEPAQQEVPALPEGIAQQEVPASPEEPAQETRPPRSKRPARIVSRRNLLTGGAVAAASLALGATAGAALERDQVQEPPVPQPTPQAGAASWETPLIGANVPTRWHRVIALDQIGSEAYPFQTESIVGYVMRNGEQSTQDNDEDVVALSAACTHMGCLVHWQAQGRTFLCPCHGGLFNEYGNPASDSPLLYLRSLPRLNTRIGTDGYVYVEVPAVTQ